MTPLIPVCDVLRSMGGSKLTSVVDVPREIYKEEVTLYSTIYDNQAETCRL